MKTFEYTAWDAHGNCREGLRQANTQEEILSALREENLTPMSVVERVSENARKAAQVRGRKIRSQELSSFCWQLGTMISGGLPIITAIETIGSELPNRYFEYILKDVSERLQQGQPFYEILQNYPKVFNKLTCAMVQAGETGGTLTACLQQLAEYYENRDKLVRKVRGALMYPIFVVVFIIGIIITLMTVIIPRFSTLFEQFKGKLPAFTRGFIGVYNFLTNNAMYILLAIAVLITTTVVMSRTKNGARFLSRLSLKIPLIGQIRKMAFVSQFCKTLSTLLSSGVSLMDAFVILAGMTDNEFFHDGVINTRERIVEGLSISKSMEITGFFPNVAVKMVQIGEQSGSLSSVLEKTSQYYEKQVEGLISTMLAVLEPLLIVIVGGIVLAVVLAMYLPIFSMQV
jgi:type IV pilus assembly protein PilC